jgi:hypothetical protein
MSDLKKFADNVFTKESVEKFFKENRSYVKRVQEKSDKDEYFYTKKLSYEIKSGALCKLITAQKDRWKLDISAHRDSALIIQVSAAVQNHGADNKFQRDKLVNLQVEEIVMFLKLWTENESLVLAKDRCYIVSDKNLEPVVSHKHLPEDVKIWIENFRNTRNGGLCLDLLK